MTLPNPARFITELFLFLLILVGLHTHARVCVCVYVGGLESQQCLCKISVDRSNFLIWDVFYVLVDHDRSHMLILGLS